MAAGTSGRGGSSVTHRSSASASPYPSIHSILIAIKSLAKKQDEIHEKLCGVERKLLSFVQDSFDITKMPYYVSKYIPVTFYKM